MKKKFDENKTFLGIELGSTRIKAVLTDDSGTPIASGGSNWENHFDGKFWTYPLDEVEKTLQSAYKDLTENVASEFGVTLKRVAAIGFSAMMHGFLAFDKTDQQLGQFRTWRNTTTEKAASFLSEKLNFTLPQRWSASHLFQAALDKEDFVPKIAFMTTLSGYIHWKMTGQKVLGIGDASGMFPIDSKTHDFNADFVKIYDELLAENGVSLHLKDIFPRVMVAGENAGVLTAEGAKMLDPSGNLQPGIPLCAPEGDAGTGMVATNSVRAGTGNVSAGTSVFSMIVLKNPLSRPYPEIDMVTTPAGDDVAMVHCNNCTNDINAWFSLFNGILQAFGKNVSTSELFDTLFLSADSGDADCSGIVNVPFLSGEPVVHTNEPLLLVRREIDSDFSPKNFVRSLIYGAFATLKIGNDILLNNEKVRIDNIFAHGGIFKTEGVAQKILADALNSKISCMKTAGEGGAWGMALLSAFMVEKGNLSLEDFLDKKIFASMQTHVEIPKEKGVAAFNQYVQKLRKIVE